jgi:ribose transport system substrate-binding protein
MKRNFLLVNVLLAASLLFAACTPAPTAQPPTVAPPTVAPPTVAPPTVAPPTVAPPTATTPPKKIRIALFVPVSGNTYEEARQNGAKDEAAKLNAEVTAFAGDYDSLKQINQIQDAIASKNFDALLIHPIDSNAVVPVVQDALKAGLVVVGADSPIGPNPDSLDPYPAGVVAFIGRTGKATGEWLGQAVIKACEGKDPCQVAYLIGMQNLTIDQVRYQNFQDTIKPYPNIKIVAFQEALYRKDKGYQVMQNVFQANPKINVVTTSGDQMVLGALQAAQEAGLNDVMFIGNGASKEGCDAVKAGLFYATIADIPYTQGQLLVETAVKALTGDKSFATSVDLNKVSPPLPKDGPVITKDALSQFECQW